MNAKRLLQDNTLKKILLAVVLVVCSLGLYLFTRKHKKITVYGLAGDGEITETRAQYLAEVLFDAMKSAGTDEKKISEVHDELAKHGRAILQVHEAFGLQRYAFIGSDYLGTKLNLNQWLQKELSAKQYAQWQALYERATK